MSDVWSALVKWKRARERFQAYANYDTTHAYCAAVEELEKLVVAHENAQFAPVRLYQCPTCGVADKTAYITCNHPMCPDGRDPR